MTVIKQ